LLFEVVAASWATFTFPFALLTPTGWPLVRGLEGAPPVPAPKT